MSNPSNFLVILLGPTGVGKTSISIKLSKALEAPILSADSRQFFREMRIGTAAPSNEQLIAAPHHFIAHKSISERYSCGMFEIEALKLLESIYQTQSVALLVGGSMLYIDAVCKGIDDFPIPDPELRKTLEDQLKNEGIEKLRAQLKVLDLEKYNSIDLKNPQRILKAVEVCLQTGKSYSTFLTQPKRERAFKIVKIGLNRPREELYNLINQRVEKMVVDGLVDEARNLLPLRNQNALKTVGYREIFDYLDGNISLEQAIELIKRNSRHYAKRQLTWWGRDPEIKWFHPEDEDGIIRFVREKLHRPGM